VAHLASGLRTAEVHVEPGGHDVAYWTRVLLDEIDWLGAGLSAERAQQ
jgi:hypothetical protein